MSEVTAYEKMLKDGTAFKKIDMNQIAAQQYAQADINAIGGGKIEKPLGDPIKENTNLEEDNTDWSSVDEAMQKRINSLRDKVSISTAKKSLNESKEIASLKRRVEKLEEAIMLVMETHEKLIG